MDDDEPISRRPEQGSPKKPKRSAKAPKPVRLRPVTKKIGESDDNIQQRAEWFRRRTTGDKHQD